MLGAAPTLEDRSVFRSRDLVKIKELKSHFYYWYDDYLSRGDEEVTEVTFKIHEYYINEFLPLHLGK